MSVVDSLNAYRRWMDFKGDDIERNALFIEWADANRVMFKGRASEQDKMSALLKRILEEEIEKVAGKREPTKEELELALNRAAERIGEELVAGFREQARKAYEKGLKQVGRDLAYPFKMGGVHEGALKTLIEGKGVAESFAGFSKTISTRFNEIVAEAFRAGAPASGPIVLRMIDEVGWERRKSLERIARTETWKVWETSRMNAYEEFERETDEKLLYRFGRDLKDKKQCKICTEIIRRTEDGVSLEELKRIVIAVSTDTTFGGSPKWNPTRDGGFPLSHPNCRHGFWRTVSKEIRKGRKYPQEIEEQVGAWQQSPEGGNVPNLPQVMGRRALREGFSGESNLITSEEGDKIAGAMSWNEVQHPKHGRAIHINHLGADRGKGHGKKLMQQVAQESVDRDVPIILEPTDEAEKFYQHLGFEWDRDPDKGDVMMLHPYRARTLLRALRLWEPDTDYLMKLSHGVGRYCDIPGHCFASPQGLAGHAAQTGHPVPAKQVGESSILSAYDPEFRITADMRGPIAPPPRTPEQKKPKSELETAVKTRIETDLESFRDKFNDGLQMAVEYQIRGGLDAERTPEQTKEDMIEAAEEVANDANKKGYTYSWETFMDKVTPSSGPNKWKDERHIVEDKTHNLYKEWAHSNETPRAFPLWAWAALKFQNPHIPETVIVGKRTNPSMETFADIEASVQRVQGLVRKIDPTYNPETDTITVYRGIKGATGKAIGKHIAKGDEEDALIDHRTLESWTASPRVAKNFMEEGGGEEHGVMINASIPVSSVVGAFYADESLYGGEAEYIVATPHGSAYYKRDDFLFGSAELHDEQAIADTAWSAVVERLSGFRVEKIGRQEEEDDQEAL